MELTLTDVDLKLICDFYKFTKYEIKECYFASKRYLPIEFYNFILQKYVDKTQLKGVEGKEIEYALSKNQFNALYGMSVTNNIRDEVVFDNESGWREEKLSNTEIVIKLMEEKRKGVFKFFLGRLDYSLRPSTL